MSIHLIKANMFYSNLMKSNPINSIYVALFGPIIYCVCIDLHVLKTSLNINAEANV
jgi:hypothetical protein